MASCARAVPPQATCSSSFALGTTLRNGNARQLFANDSLLYIKPVYSIKLFECHVCRTKYPVQAMHHRTSNPCLQAKRTGCCSSISRQRHQRFIVCNSTQRPVLVPQNPGQQSEQAAASITAAFKDGLTRQRVELSLPLIDATDLDDWPGGVRQQFKAVQPLVEKILQVVKQVEGLQGPLIPEIWDDGDAVACWRSQNLAAVVFPTAQTLKRVKQLAEGPDAPALLLIVNPQWDERGSDFGFGPWRREREEAAALFQTTYWLRQQRVYGDLVRVFRAHPGLWQAYVGGATGGPTELLLELPARPSYQQIEDKLRAMPDASINKSIMERMDREFKFNKDSLNRK